MPREAILLNAEKVRHLIAKRGIPRKQLLPDKNPKTLQRILRGDPTSLTTAYQLASALGVQSEDLTRDIDKDDFMSWLPEHWFYEDGPASNLAMHWPSMVRMGLGSGYVIGAAPPDLNSPLTKLLALDTGHNRKVVLRRNDGAFVVEIHHFDYDDREQNIVYRRSSSCRFFPIVRDGDTFRRDALSDRLANYLWTWLYGLAIDNAEILEIDGETFPEHPHAYRPLAIFSKGILGVRLFSQLQVDFRASLAEYVGTIDDRTRIHATATSRGISIVIQPSIKVQVAHAPFNPIRIDVVLVCSSSDGRMQLAPWRYEHRQEYADAINNLRPQDFHSRGMPLRYFPADYADDPPIPPLSADPDIPAERLAAIKDIDWLDADEHLWAS